MINLDFGLNVSDCHAGAFSFPSWNVLFSGPRIFYIGCYLSSRLCQLLSGEYVVPIIICSCFYWKFMVVDVCIMDVSVRCLWVKN